ncbi:MAG TPA: GNAT family N-acetyltransferase [Pyrinomonadaceae bacterium]|nr:GNAT family N-acetyltransferase [Pyrinomonadaceae bacterium]
MSDKSQFGIGIRDIASIDEMGAVEELQREVWACGDIDVVPRLMLHPAREVGGTLVGAFDGARLVGFAFGFVGLEHGRLVLHSHMLAVKAEYRGHSLGARLKLAQRERALRQGIELMTWTYDPLQGRNAQLNFARLGVVSDDYRVDYYGDVSTSPLHRGTGTDRLWVTWRLDDERVRGRIDAPRGDPESRREELGRATPLVRAGAGAEPETFEIAGRTGGGLSSIEIPGDINELQRSDLGLARRWREATRAAFRAAFAAGYVAEEFIRGGRNGDARGAYLLRWRGDGGG